MECMAQKKLAYNIIRKRTISIAHSLRQCSRVHETQVELLSHTQNKKLTITCAKWAQRESESRGGCRRRTSKRQANKIDNGAFEIKISTSFTLLQNYSVARVEWNVQNLSHSISILYLCALFDINLLNVVLFVAFVFFLSVCQTYIHTERQRQTKFIGVHIAIEWIK